jgi:hypothetical protein
MYVLTTLLQDLVRSLVASVNIMWLCVHLFRSLLCLMGLLRINWLKILTFKYDQLHVTLYTYSSILALMPWK